MQSLKGSLLRAGAGMQGPDEGCGCDSMQPEERVREKKFVENFHTKTLKMLDRKRTDRRVIAVRSSASLNFLLTQSVLRSL